MGPVIGSPDVSGRRFSLSHGRHSAMVFRSAIEDSHSPKACIEPDHRQSRLVPTPKGPQCPTVSEASSSRNQRGRFAPARLVSDIDMNVIRRCLTCLTPDLRTVYSSPADAHAEAPERSRLRRFYERRNSWRCQACGSRSFIVVEHDARAHGYGGASVERNSAT